MTLFADLDRRSCMFATPGRDADSVTRFVADLRAHGGEPEQVLEVCQDMSEPYLFGVLGNLLQAEITFDRYHVKAQLSQALDQVRRGERKQHAELLQGSRYLWLRRPESLNEKQRARLDALLQQPLQTVRAYTWALKFDAVYQLTGAEAQAHWTGILRWFQSRVSNGLLEGLNSLVQAAKRRARGYRSTRNYIAMIYLTVGKLNLDLPT